MSSALGEKIQHSGIYLIYYEICKIREVLCKTKHLSLTPVKPTFRQFLDPFFAAVFPSHTHYSITNLVSRLKDRTCCKNKKAIFSSK